MNNENLRLDYLNRLGVVSWMPRQPLPGARPSEFFYHEGAEAARRPLRVQAEPASEPVTASAAPVRPAPAAATRPAEAEQPVPEHDSADPMAALEHSEQVNRVPESLQLMFIRPQSSGPLIVSHFGEQGDAGEAFLPFVQSLLQFTGCTAPLVSLPFVWPLTGMPGACREQEFIDIFEALLSGARLGCPPGQECWWFGDLPQLLAESECFTLGLHYPASLTEVLNQPGHKPRLLKQLITRRQEKSAP